MSGRNRFIDVLKGFCIVAVVFTHVEWSGEQTRKLLFPFWIDMAVPFFMLVSGYVYAKSFVKNKVEDLDSAYSRKYLLKNSIRYTLPFFAAYMLELAWRFLTRKSSGLKEVKDFFITAVFGFLSGGYGPGSYYYPEMMQIMFLFPIIYILVKKFSFKGVIIVTAATLFFELLKIPFGVQEGTYRLLLFRYFMLLAFGAYFAFKKMNWKMWGLSVLGLAFILLFRYTDYKPKIFFWWTGTSMLPVLFIVPVFGFLVEKKLSLPPMEEIGRASYNIFLTQLVYFSSISGIIAGRLGHDVWLEALVSVAICVPVGILFYELEHRITRKVTNLAIASLT
ncbi:MAG: acyltransferase family protein [Treponema sp.]|nr:acyltransferase family protein [Treponema sp.]